MTFLDAAAQSKTFRRAWGDLVDGFGKRELWLHLGWQDIKQRYRRSVLGPFWITIATGTTAVAMGGLYSVLFKLELSEHLPYVTLGLIIWNLINASILEGAEVFIANEGLIKQGDEEGTLLFTFVPSNWDEFQTFQVFGVDDNYADGAKQYNVKFSSVLTFRHGSETPRSKQLPELFLPTVLLHGRSQGRFSSLRQPKS